VQPCTVLLKKAKRRAALLTKTKASASTVARSLQAKSRNEETRKWVRVTRLDWFQMEVLVNPLARKIGPRWLLLRESAA
jgi:hypothetical protein